MSMRQLKITKSITNRETQSLEKYLQEISKVDLISPEEEVQLAIRIREGDQHALERLVNANLRFVVSVAKQYQNQGLTLPDLINEGNLGLMKAAVRFDETKGFKFISYAVWWVRQGILQSLAEQGRIVRLPLNKVGLNGRVSRAWQQLEQQFEREPTPEEVARMLGMHTDEVAATINSGVRHLSMDSPISDGEESTLLDVMPCGNVERTDQQVEYHESLHMEVQRSLRALTERQREVVCYFFGIGVENAMSLEDIGERFQLTRERVRQIKDKAITKLRSTDCAGQLRVYLG